MLLIALLLVSQQQNKPLAGPPSPDERRYHDCLKLATSDPPHAEARAGEWRLAGGGFLAEQCLGIAFANQGKWASAASEFTGAARSAQANRDPRAATYWAEAGNARLAGGDAAGARAALDAALASGTLESQDRAEAQLDRARALVATGNLSQARVDLDHALKAVPHDSLAWLLSATLARRMGDLARAQKDIAEAEKRAPKAAPVELEKGNIAAVNGDEASAKTAWKRAVAVAPESDAGHTAAQALQQFDRSNSF